MTSTLARVQSAPYTAYAYSYPHKTAYRPLHPPVSLKEAWKDVNKSALFLYFHIPFCEMRCGFCNLFTTAHPPDDLQKLYMKQLRLQAQAVRSALGDCNFARMALGGGTPTYLDESALAEVFRIAEDVFGVDTSKTPISVETSPKTATQEKLLILKENNVERVSIGVQSFVDAETSAAGRAQSCTEVAMALTRINDLNFPVLNIDLIYGLPGQDKDSLLYSLEKAMEYHPAEVYIYPLYVRPLTGLGKKGDFFAASNGDSRQELYEAACEFLKSKSYRQCSMRMFQLESAATPAAPQYCCQTDGMVGIGAGARSYTQSLHYSSNYAVNKDEVRSIIDRYICADFEDLMFATNGFHLNCGEQKRRFIIQSLLQAEGLSMEAYSERFHSNVMDDLPVIEELLDAGLAARIEARITLTDSGVQMADAISYELYSSEVKQLMAEYKSK